MARIVGAAMSSVLLVRALFAAEWSAGVPEQAHPAACTTTSMTTCTSCCAAVSGFCLFPPALARRMYTTGKIKTVHPSGCIVYEGQVCGLTCMLKPSCTSEGIHSKQHPHLACISAQAVKRCNRMHHAHPLCNVSIPYLLR